MKRLDRLVVGELFGPWAFGVALFSALLMAATYLNRITNYIAQGVPVGTVMELAALLMPSILVKTFAMAVLLAALLAFGRLSSDSEVVAMRAGGASLTRIVMPVVGFSLGVALFAFAANEVVVPAAAHRALLMQDSIAKTLDVKSLRPLSYPIRDAGKVVAMVSAQDFSPAERVLRGATIIVYGEGGLNAYYMWAKELEFDPERFREGGGWRIRGGGTVTTADGSQHVVIDGQAWPPEVPDPDFDVDDLITGMGNIKEPDFLSMKELGEQIRREQGNPNASRSDIRNLQYWYWNKIALPLAALVFGALGAGLGIRHHRTGSGTGFAMTVAIFFGYTTIANFMNVWARGGVFPPYIASFSPIVIGLLLAGVVLWRRNT